MSCKAAGDYFGPPIDPAGWWVRAGIGLGLLLVAVSFVVGIFSGDHPDGGSSPARRDDATPGSATPPDGGSASPAPQASPAYTQGVADWDALRAYFMKETGDRRVGADYWAANRNGTNPPSCFDASGDFTSNPKARTCMGRLTSRVFQRRHPLLHSP